MSGKYRRLVFPAHLQGVGIGILLGAVAETIHGLAALAALVAALVLITWGYVQEKRVRND